MFSVIIPAYNRNSAVRDAIESVFRQTLPPVEIIIVDDCSDKPLEHSLAPYLSKIKIIRAEKNAGVSSARNIGIAVCSGKYVAFLDSDDLWTPDKCRIQIEAMIKYNWRASHTDEHWYRQDRWVNQGKQHTKYGGHIFCKILDKCRISPSAFMLDRELLNRMGGFNEQLIVCEDYEFFLRLALETEIGYLPEKLTIKRAIEKNSLSASIKHIESTRLKILEQFASEHILSREYQMCLQNELERKKKIVGEKAL
ncbi:MAG: glycosyltransferase [Deferribacteraceae bacterium]|jgi:glycosyltransferase involved in cell wall biosynthesis|nr:glycosyltransferase [Deferribacteraceae bacterium]